MEEITLLLIKHLEGVDLENVQFNFHKDNYGEVIVRVNGLYHCSIYLDVIKKCF